MLRFSVSDFSLVDGNKIVLSVPLFLAEGLQKLVKAITGGKRIDVELKIHYKPRSLNANAALWAMLGDMAAVLGSTADELYLAMLERYGVSRFIAIYPEDYDAEAACHRVVRSRGSTWVNCYRFTVLEVWDGSSRYDSAQFSRLLDGVISEAADLGVPFLSKADRDLLMSSYEQDRGGSNAA